jgi:hypothetical protein
MSKRVTNGIEVDRLNQQIEDLGVRIKIWKSTVCPNLQSIESMDHNVNCTICNNNMIDFACRETVALIQQQDLVEKFKLEGTFSMDEVLMTFKSDVTLHIFAKVQILDFAEDFFELVQRQEGSDTDKLKYPACKILGVFSAAGNVKTEYFEGADFQIDVNGNIKWTGTHKPSDKDVYSIYYQHHPVFRAVKALHRDRYSQYNIRPENIQAPKKTVGDRTYVKLPETWILKRDYLLERRDQDGNIINDNQYYDPNEP